MEPILSEKELEDIFAVAREQISEGREISDLSLTARRRFESRAAGTWQEAAKVMKPAMGSVVAGAIGEQIEIDLLDIASLDAAGLGADAMADMETDGWIYSVFGCAENEIIVGVSKSLARSYIGRRTGTGSKGMGNVRIDDALTGLERRILAPCLAAIAAGVGGAVPGGLDLKLLSKDPAEVIGSRRKKQTWMEMTVHCKGRDDLGIWVAANALLFSSENAVIGSAMALHIHQTHVSISADLGRVTMTADSFQKLRRGEIVQLDRMLGDPFPVCIAGVPKLLGDPINSRGNVAIRLTGRIETGGNP